MQKTIIILNMIYNLKTLNKELTKESQQLSEKFIGIRGNTTGISVICFYQIIITNQNSFRTNSD